MNYFSVVDQEPRTEHGKHRPRSGEIEGWSATKCDQLVFVQFFTYNGFVQVN